MLFENFQLAICWKIGKVARPTGSGSANTETNIHEGTLSLLTSRRCGRYIRERERKKEEKEEECLE